MYFSVDEANKIIDDLYVTITENLESIDEITDVNRKLYARIEELNKLKENN